MWVETLQLRDVRNIRALELELSPGLNVFVGENAQGKTSLLEAVGLLARGRSFRSADSRAMIRRGTSGLRAAASARDAEARAELAIELDGDGRRAVCARFSERGQALVTTAHPPWTGALPDGARVFAVAAGELRLAYGALGRA